MLNRLLRSARARAIVLLCLALCSAGCGNIVIPNLPEVTVTNLPGEDLAGPCTYAMRLTPGPVLIPGQPATEIPQTGVLVVFERGDSLSLFEDPSVISMAQGLHLAMMYAYQCDASSFDDLQPDGSKGPGRALFQALNQFAVSLTHPELANANVFLTGFSAAGYLSISLADIYPDRVLGTVPYAPASGYFALDQLDITRAARIPSLMLVSGTDLAAGDQIPFFLFLDGRARGAPWGFASQHDLNHCCVDSTASLLNPWIHAIFTEETTARPDGTVVLKPPTLPAPATVAFQVTVDGSFDVFGWQDFYFGSYSLLPSTSGGPYFAWLPDAATTQAWIDWTTRAN